MKTALIKLLLIVLLGGVTAPGSLSASERTSPPRLTIPELIAQSWDELSPQERSRALENYRRFQKLPPEKKQSLEEQYNRWMQLPSKEQERIRRNYNRYRGMNSDEKEDFYRKYKQWRSLPR
jgi:hypothetical protein